MSWLINAAQLDKFRKNQKNIVIFDASWYLPTDGKDARQDYLESRIAGARFLDLSQFFDHTNPLPNMLLRDEKAIEKVVSELGITNDFKIIFYDNSPLHSSCRALWMFKVFGHHPNQLYILDGGLAAWEKYGGKFESGEPKQVAAKHYSVMYQAQLIRSLVQMKTNLHHPIEQVVDLRHPVRYAGGPEARPNMRAGHIPRSFSFPYMTMFEADGKFKPMEKIRKQLEGIGVDLGAPIVTTCGSGMTAPILNFMLELMGHDNHAVYDGSWSEWGAEQLYAGEMSALERPVIRSIDIRA